MLIALTSYITIPITNCSAKRTCSKKLARIKNKYRKQLTQENLIS